jgi:hypothetical protein
MKEGCFRLKTSNGRIIFEGNFENDKAIGFGKVIIENITYKGEW